VGVSPVFCCHHVAPSALHGWAGKTHLFMRHKALSVLQHVSANSDHTSELFQRSVLPLLLHEIKSEPNDTGCRLRALSALVNLSGAHAACALRDATAVRANRTRRLVAQFEHRPLAHAARQPPWNDTTLE
jgi:hypothetical protein